MQRFLFAKVSYGFMRGVEKCTIMDVMLISLCFGLAFGTAPWSQYAGNAQHTAISRFGSQPLERIQWSAPVDLNPQYSGGELLIHYGSPLLTNSGTVIQPVKSGIADGFEFRAFTSTGTPIWTQTIDYSLPPHDWTPSCAGALVSEGNLVAMPAAGGTVLFRSMPDSRAGRVSRGAFYGNATYQNSETTFNSNVKICTPLMAAPSGPLFFGFRVFGATTAKLASGIARLNPSPNEGRWVSASAAADDPNITAPVMNCASALSNDGKYVYIAVSNGSFGYGYLLCLDSVTLRTVNKVRLKDPDGDDALLPDEGTASPMVGPDGDVYFGVLENPFPYNHDRGWMLHFDSTLSVQKPTGAFGWDDTASVVPARAVPSYAGTSKYLICTKYNNYAGVGGDGHNKVGILDPNDTQVDPITGNTIMKEIMTVLGVTADSEFPNTPGAVREWCINSAVIDPAGKCAIINSEDGSCYRWNFVTNTLDLTVPLTSGIGEAYTPTIIMPDGAALAINNATMWVLGR